MLDILLECPEGMITIKGLTFEESLMDIYFRLRLLGDDMIEENELIQILKRAYNSPFSRKE